MSLYDIEVATTVRAALKGGEPLLNTELTAVSQKRISDLRS
jgi:hypothetical protein